MLERRGTAMALPVLFLSLLCAQVAFVYCGPLMAVDFGGEFLRISVVKPGRNPISVVLNEASKRRTSAQVAFVDKERLLGEEAATLSVRYPDRVYARTRDLLGRQAGDEDLHKMMEQSFLPHKIVPFSKERPTAAIQSDSGEVYSAEELVASILHYARSITEAVTEGAAVLDCVITVPAFWGPAQRQALIDAAKISGVNVLALINTHAAAALQYGIERDFANKTQLVIFYDMGATTTECALVEFSTFRMKEGGIMKTYGQFEVKDVAWDAGLGSEDLDVLLLNHFSEEFKAAHGVDPRDSPKAVAKLKRQAKRTKEMLSANTFAPISVEELINSLDFRSQIQRTKFEELASDYLARAAKPLTEILRRSGVSVKDVAAVELLGGGSRVPAVKAALSEALGGRQLDMHLDADEAVVLGAGLFAANLSTTFRLRKFGMIDGITYPISYQLEPPEKAAVSPELEHYFRPKALLPRMKRLPARRMVPLPNITTVDSLRAVLSFNTSGDAAALPPGIKSNHLATYEISGIKEVVAKHNDTGKLSLHFRADESGILVLEKGEAVIETTEDYVIKVPVMPPQPASDANSTEDSSEEGLIEPPASEESAAGNETETNATAKEPPPLVFEDVVKTRRKILRAPLSIGGPGFNFAGLPPDAIKASKKVLEKLARAEQERKEASKQKNELESYIIAFKGRLSDDSTVVKVTNEKQRADFATQLDAAEEWLYSEGEAEPAASFLNKQKELRKMGDAIELREKELAAFPKAHKAALDFIKVSRQAISGWETTKPWLNATDVEDLKAQIDGFESWLKTEGDKQKSRKSHEDPSLLSSAVEARVELLRKPFNTLKSKKKPKPPPTPKTSNSTANATDKAEAGADDEGSSLNESKQQEPDHDEL